MFAPEGTTPIRLVWKMRLERTREYLLAGHDLRVRRFSRFARAFKAEFGITPTSIRTW